MIEAEQTVPFQVRRVYYIFGTEEGIERGFHVHKALNQVAVAVAGSCDMVLDDGHSINTIHMSSPIEGVLIPPNIWHYMKNFSPDCVLVVLADTHYDEADYIRDYDEFTSWISKQKK